MSLKYTLLFVFFLLYQVTIILTGTCERENFYATGEFVLCRKTCYLLCKNTTENEVLESLRGNKKVKVHYGSLLSVSSLFLDDPNLMKVLQIRENEKKLKIQEIDRPLTQEIGLEDLTIENTDIELLYDTKLFNNFGKLKKLSINKCLIKRVFYEFFQGASNLEYVSLKSNGIVEIHNQAFYNLNNLKYVDLSENLIKSLPYNNFRNAFSLQEFRINQNPLSEFNLEKFLLDKPNLWMANMAGIYCNTFRFAIMDTYQKLGYKPTYRHEVICSTPPSYNKCNFIIMEDSNQRNITIAEANILDKDPYQFYYHDNINDVFFCLDDCSTQLFDYFHEDDEYADQLGASVLQYYMSQLQYNFKQVEADLRSQIPNITELKENLDKLEFMVNITSFQIEGKL